MTSRGINTDSVRDVTDTLWPTRAWWT